MNLDPLLAASDTPLTPQDKAARMVTGLNQLVAHHVAHCPPYARLVSAFFPDRVSGRHAAATSLEEVPWLPVGLFKSHRLVSVPEDQVFKTMTSSGTTDGRPSRIVLDRQTASLQARGLARVMTGLLGKQRLPMLIVDIEGLFSDPAGFSARGAGVLGMMTFGRHHLYVLDEQLELRIDALRDWLAEHGDAPFLVFGFTWMVWRYLVDRLPQAGLDLRNGILVHAGGWKKLQDQAVDRATFKARLRDVAGITRCHDFYGMVEQVGGVFLEGEDGLLHPPDFADVLVREPGSWRVLPPGQPGVIQLLSLLPRSYPGHSLLTEDMGVVHQLPDGRRALTVLGRAPRAELRGCSDTFQPGVA